MVGWIDFEVAEPELAALARMLLYQRGDGVGLLSTVPGEGLPRTHPVNVGIVEGRLLTFVQAGSAKARDLTADGRYALHGHVDPAVPHELLVRGRGAVVHDPGTRSRAAEAWPFTPDESYFLVELDIEHVLVGERPDADAWPPRYRSWRPAPAVGAG